jgi:cytochrome c556
VQASLKTMVEAAAKMPTLFLEDSKTGDDTKALPAIWSDKADLTARYAKLGQDATAALATIKDQASFFAAMPGIFKNCGGCHEK